jgi:rhamnosyl/mannosyltransferase
VDDLLQALKETEATLLVAGDGPMRPAWEQLSWELDLKDRVKFLGHVPDAQLPGLYASADLFVLPANSRAEAFGKVLLEAMSAGLPCITTELGTGTSFVVQHEVTGLVVAPGEPRALAVALKRLLNDDALRRKMGAAAKKRVAHEFSPQRMAQAVEEVYHEVLHGGAPCTTNET